MRSLDLEVSCLCALLFAGASGCKIVQSSGEGSQQSAAQSAAGSNAHDETAGTEADAAQPRSGAAAPSRGPAAGSGGRGASAGGPAPVQKPAPAANNPEPLASGTADECTQALAAPEMQCLAMDRVEPNDEDSPAMLPLTPTCGYVVANLIAKDEDGYAFMVDKADPVLVELAYTTQDIPDLEFLINAPDSHTITTQSGSRKGPREDLSAIVHAAAGARYVVKVAATSGSSVCQSYALRVDQKWCTDQYEDNDSLEQATKLNWGAEQRVTATGTLSSGDRDVFEIATTRADPVLLTGEYQADPTDTIQVRRTIYNAAGTSMIDEIGNRKTERETFTHWLKATSKDAVLRTELSPTGSGCAPYTLTFDAAACTDPYEDNDSPETAAVLPIGGDVQVTGFAGDKDHYRIESLANGGNCALRYAIPVGRSQQLRVEVYNGAGAQVTNALGGDLVGNERQLRVSWGPDRGVASIRVQPDTGGYCQPYTIRCDPPTGQ